MTKSLAHKFVSAVADGADSTLVRPSNWNADHNFYLGIRTVTGTTDTITDSDNFTLVVYNSSSAIAVSIPAPTGGNMTSGWYTKFYNIGTGAVTVTGTSSATINGAASVVLNTNDTIEIYSQNTNNYYGDYTPGSGIISTFGIDNLSLNASVASNILTVSVRDAAGNFPSASSSFRISFRNATMGTGSLVIDTVSSSLSIATVVGASLGSSSSTAFRLWVVAFENSGSVVLALYNASIGGSNPQIYPISEFMGQSSTLIGSGSIFAGTFYATSALTNRPIRILGFVEYNSTGLTTAGTYSRVPDTVQVFGPGIYKPGESIQHYQTTGTNGTITASTSFVTTGIAITPTVVSAANIMEIEWSGGMAASSASTTNLVQLARGTINNTNLIGSVPMVFGASSGVQATGVTRVLDKPNVAGGQSYSLQMKSDSGSNVYMTGTIYQMSYREIMG